MESEYLKNRRAIMLGQKPAPVKAAPKPIAPQSKKKIQELKDTKPQRVVQGDWFEERIAEQTGVCMECGGPTHNALFVYAKMTVAHVLPKRENGGCPSVAAHVDNALELCAENGCHHEYDSSWETATKMKVWPIAVEKFKKIYPFVAQKERKNIPLQLLQEVEPISI